MTRATPRPNKARLRRAIKFLEELELPEGAEFDMGTFGRHFGGHRPSARNHCGTVACALGWLSLDPWFRDRGLKGTWRKADGGHYLRIKHGKDDFTGAAESFFGLTWRQANEAFFASTKARCIAVLKRAAS